MNCAVCAILYSVLKNERSPYLDTVLFNAGLGFFSNGRTASVEDGILLARRCVKDGAAMDKLQEFLKVQVEVA